MGDHVNLGITRLEVTDKGLQLARPTAAPTVLLIGLTDNTVPELEDPFRIERGSELSDFDLAAGGPSELTKAAQESMGAGAQNIELFVLSDGSGSRWGTLTPVNRYNLLDRAYPLLRNHEVDFAVPVGAYVDSPGLVAGNSFWYQLANFCYRGTREFTSRFGVIGATPPTEAVATTGRPTLAEQAAWVAALNAFDTSALQGVAFPEFDGVTDVGGDGTPDNYCGWATTDEVMPTGPADSDIEVDDNKNSIDVGMYTACYAGWERFRNDAGKRLYPTLGYYNNSGAAAYAGLLAATKSYEAARNIPLPGAAVIRNLSTTQADSLSVNRFIVSCRKVGQYQVYDAPTTAHNISQYLRSDFVRITTVRVMFDSVDQTRAASNPFIRLLNSPTNREALKEAIDEGLKILRGKGLEKWDFDLIYTPAMRVLGELLIDLSLWISEEIQTIRLRIGLRR
jgi:hypothetical protein